MIGGQRGTPGGSPYHWSRMLNGLARVRPGFVRHTVPPNLLVSEHPPRVHESQEGGLGLRRGWQGASRTLRSKPPSKKPMYSHRGLAESPSKRVLDGL